MHSRSDGLRGEDGDRWSQMIGSGDPRTVLNTFFYLTACRNVPSSPPSKHQEPFHLKRTGHVTQWCGITKNSFHDSLAISIHTDASETPPRGSSFFIVMFRWCATQRGHGNADHDLGQRSLILRYLCLDCFILTWSSPPFAFHIELPQ